MVDCSHGNSSKDYRRQGEVLRSISAQVAGGSVHVMGVMIESHLVAGAQKIPADLSQLDLSSLTYGQSITDACIDLPTTLALLDELAAAVQAARQRQLAPA
jgi:3-deoxy-7-phosphoheptulonate synthase